MKAILLVICFFSFTSLFSQPSTNYESIILEKGPDYKAADSLALEASTFLFATPFEKNNIQRLRSLSFIIRWMSGTPDYSFTLDEVASKLMKGNDDFLGLYMAAMTKYSLENTASSKDQKLVKLNAITMLLNYCENANNNMKMTKQLKKLSEAKANGQLEQAL